MEENKLAVVLAEKEFVGSDALRNCHDTLQAYIESNDTDGFRFFLLHQVD